MKTDFVGLFIDVIGDYYDLIYDFEQYWSGHNFAQTPILNEVLLDCWDEEAWGF